MTTLDATPRELDVERVAPLAMMLADAMDVDAAYRYLFPDASRRPAGLGDLFARNLRLHLPQRCTSIALDDRGALAATVTLRAPDAPPISLLKMLRAGLVPFARAHGLGAVRRLLWIRRAYDALERRAARGVPHWHVHMMAVRRDLQGRGLGGALLARVLERGIGSTHPIVLSTHLPENVVFYRRAGFEVVGEQQLQPPGALPYPVWSMRR